MPVAALANDDLGESGTDANTGAAPEAGETSTPEYLAKPAPAPKPKLHIEYVPSRSVRGLFEKAWLARY
jgi:hypothetical protein